MIWAARDGRDIEMPADFGAISGNVSGSLIRFAEKGFVVLKQCLTIVGLLLWAGGAVAQDVKVGADLYRNHCATCHGMDATEQGPMAGVLVIKPVDLTALTATNDGEFPVARGAGGALTGARPWSVMAARCQSRAISLRAKTR